MVWFIQDDSKYVLEESIKAEKKLKLYINEIKKKYSLENSNICLSGVSQGCMMCINVGLTSDTDFNCVVGFPGKIINKENLSNKITSRTKMFLTLGDMDTVVSSTHLLEAKDFLLRNNVEVEIKMINNSDHHIPIEASSSALNYIKKNLII